MVFKRGEVMVRNEQQEAEISKVAIVYNLEIVELREKNAEFLAIIKAYEEMVEKQVKPPVSIQNIDYKTESERWRKNSFRIKRQLKLFSKIFGSLYWRKV